MRGLNTYAAGYHRQIIMERSSLYLKEEFEGVYSVIKDRGFQVERYLNIDDVVDALNTINKVAIESGRVIKINFSDDVIDNVPVYLKRNIRI